MPKWKGSEAFTFRELEPGLLSIEASGGVRQRRHSYLLRLPSGNVLIHGPDAPAFYVEHRPFLEEHGGVAWQLLTHHDEASRGSVAAWKAWSAPVRVHHLDAADVARKAPGVPIDQFSGSRASLGALEGIWLPGHSAGFTAFRWEGELGVYLFGGDLAIPRGERWNAYGDRDAYRRSLQMLVQLEVDFLLPNKSQESAPPPIPFGSAVREQAAEQINAALAARASARGRRRTARETSSS
jgi:glyoxylase-like metal-dependent hydrolase (beta-lactamase superfamily II)